MDNNREDHAATTNYDTISSDYATTHNYEPSSYDNQKTGNSAIITNKSTNHRPTREQL